MRTGLCAGVLCGLCGLLALSGAEAEPKAPPAAGRALVLDLGKGLSLKLVRVPAGKFTMGSPRTERCHRKDERPTREVTITRDFHMSRCEITRGQFAAFVADAQYKTDAERDGWAFAWDGKKWDKVKRATWRKVGFAQTDEHPVICVTWNDAAAFCTWLGRKTGRTARLPTEAEWEYACRAGARSVFAWGDTLEGGKGRCNAADMTARKKFTRWGIFPWEDAHVFTAPVGSYAPNAFGLCDMHGNVWEWCADRYAASYADAGKVDPTGPAEGQHRVLRGGSWMSNPPYIRSACRRKSDVRGGGCDNIAGIRVVVEAAPPAAACLALPGLSGSARLVWLCHACLPLVGRAARDRPSLPTRWTVPRPSHRPPKSPEGV